MTNYHIGPHWTTSDHTGQHRITLGHFGPHEITWDYHTGLSEIIRPNLFKHNLLVTHSNNKCCMPGAAIMA